MRLIPTTISQKTADPADPTGGQTLDALMARHKALTEAAAQPMPAQIPSPWQGAALMAQGISNSMQQSQVASQEGAGRQALASAMQRADPSTGEMPPDALATIGQLDPDLQYKFIADTMASRRQARQQQTEWAHQAQVTDAAHQYQESQPTTEAGKMESDLKAGRITQEDFDAWKTKQAPDSYRPMTPEEKQAYGIADNQPYRWNVKEGKPEGVGGGPPQLQAIPAEVAAKLGMADVFNKNTKNITDNIDAGNLTGTGYVGAMSGMGAGSESYRQWRSGSEALVRMLTGAGMNESEARDRVSQYEPSWHDDNNSLKSKLQGLSDNLNAASAAIQQGRQPVMTPLGGNKTPPAAGTHVTDVTQIPEKKVMQLRDNPTPEMKQYFDEAFGPGMAAKALGGGG